MTVDRRSSVPDFEISGVTWQCWVTSEGGYEWRSTCGSFAVWRVGSECYARRGDVTGTATHPDLWTAMRAAQFGRSNKRAAA